ncbi:ead/Ea22-like family protein [Klebsiella aerogenes]
MTTDITELAQSLKAAAKKATPGPWALARDGKTVVSNQSHPIANVTDVMHRMLADGTTGQDAEFISLANPANILALVEALELKEEQRANWFQMAQKLGEDLDAAEKRIAELERQLNAAENNEIDARCHIAELESRTVTVKLPDVMGRPPLYAQNRTMEAVFAAAALAGVRIQVEAE